MRTSLVALLLALGLVAAPALAVAGTAELSPASVTAEQQGQPAPQAPSLDVDIDNDGGAWYANPLWVAIGVIALVLIVALILMAGRGTTTVVK